MEQQKDQEQDETPGIEVDMTDASWEMVEASQHEGDLAADGISMMHFSIASLDSEDDELEEDQGAKSIDKVGYQSQGEEDISAEINAELDTESENGVDALEDKDCEKELANVEEVIEEAHRAVEALVSNLEARASQNYASQQVGGDDDIGHNSDDASGPLVRGINDEVDDNESSTALSTSDRSLDPVSSASSGYSSENRNSESEDDEEEEEQAERGEVASEDGSISDDEDDEDDEDGEDSDDNDDDDEEDEEDEEEEEEDEEDEEEDEEDEEDEDDRDNVAAPGETNPLLNPEGVEMVLNRWCRLLHPNNAELTLGPQVFCTEQAPPLLSWKPTLEGLEDCCTIDKGPHGGLLLFWHEYLIVKEDEENPSSLKQCWTQDILEASEFTVRAEDSLPQHAAQLCFKGRPLYTSLKGSAHHEQVLNICFEEDEVHNNGSFAPFAVRLLVPPLSNVPQSRGQKPAVNRGGLWNIILRWLSSPTHVLAAVCFFLAHLSVLARRDGDAVRTENQVNDFRVYHHSDFASFPVVGKEGHRMMIEPGYLLYGYENQFIAKRIRQRSQITCSSLDFGVDPYVFRKKECRFVDSSDPSLLEKWDNNWHHLCQHGEACIAPQAGVARYGGEGRWFSKIVDGGMHFPCSARFFGVEMQTGKRHATCQFQPLTVQFSQDDFVPLCQEYSECLVRNAPGLVRFGFNGEYVFRRVGPGTEFRCDISFFGKDPAVGYKKRCDFKQDPATAPHPKKTFDYSNAGAANEEVEILRKRVETLESFLEKSRLSVAASANTVDSLSTRIEELEQQLLASAQIASERDSVEDEAFTAKNNEPSTERKAEKRSKEEKTAAKKNAKQKKSKKHHEHGKTYGKQKSAKYDKVYF